MGKKLGFFGLLRKKISNSSFKKQRKSKLSGRTMMEMLCVLCVAVILSLAAVKGWNYFDNRHRANELMEDVLTAQAKATTHKIKKGYTFETWTNILPATETKTAYEFQARLVLRKGRVAYIVRAMKNGVPTKITRDVCDQLLNMQSERFSIFALDDNFSSDTAFNELTECRDLNALMFAFTPVEGGKEAAAAVNDAQVSGNDGCTSNSDCSIGYVCVSGKCVRRSTCSNNTGCNCAPCTNGTCGTTNTSRCCNGVYCNGCSGGNCCSSDGMCACTTNAECEASYGANFSCVEDTGATTKHCRIMRCSQSVDCPDSSYYCTTNGECKKNICTKREDCLEFGSDYICSNGACVKGGCTSTEWCRANIGENTFCSSEHICIPMECTDDSYCVANFGSGYKCSNETPRVCREVIGCETDDDCSVFGHSICSGTGTNKTCKSTDCTSNSECVQRFGTGYICSNSICKKSYCTNDSYCSTNFGTGWVCLNGSCTANTCNADVDCTKFNTSTDAYRCVGTGSKVCVKCSIEYCTAHEVSGGACVCKSCSSDANTSRVLSSSRKTCVPRIPYCDGGYNDEGTCKKCSNGYTLSDDARSCVSCSSGDSGLSQCDAFDYELGGSCSCYRCKNNLKITKAHDRCCSEIQNCKTSSYIKDGNSATACLCEVNGCVDGYTTSTTQQTCCNKNDTSKTGITGCATFTDRCYCASCKSGYKKTRNYGGVDDMCCPEVAHCVTHDSKNCKCDTNGCETGYTAVVDMLNGVDRNQCCPTIKFNNTATCAKYNDNCSCNTCISNYTPVNNNMMCCPIIEHCKAPSGYNATTCKCSAAGANSCESPYVPSASYGVCCNPNDTTKVGIEGCDGFSDSCYCNACKSNYTQVTSGGNKLCCPTELNCKAYNTSDCYCKTCNDTFIKVKRVDDSYRCCPIVQNCSTYDPDTCQCTACYSGWIINSTGSACIKCANIDGCDSYDGTCKCTHCEWASMSTHLYANETGTACCAEISGCSAYDEHCRCKSCPTGSTLGYVLEMDDYGVPLGASMVDIYTGQAVLVCRARKTDCQGTTTNGECNRCPTGYIGAGGYCCSVVDHCATYDYDSGCACAACESGYYRHNGRCVSSCPAGYKSYSDSPQYNNGQPPTCYPEKCTVYHHYNIEENNQGQVVSERSYCDDLDCDDGYTTVNGMCVSPQQPACNAKYPGTGPSTDTYYSGGEAGAAGSVTCRCPYGWRWSGSQCVYCDSGATSASGSCCSEVVGCTSYNSTCLCNECVNGYYVWSDPSYPTDQGCATCDYNNFRCLIYNTDCSCSACPEGYRLTQDSTHNGKKYCKSVCESTEIYMDGVCCPDVNNCASYTFSTSDGSACGCQTCEDNYKKTTGSSTTYNTRCCPKKNFCTYNNGSSCSQNYCSAYNLDCTCSTCGTGYTLVSGDKCCSTKLNCTSYDTSSCACSACANKYYVSNGSCTSCSNKRTMDPNCKTYDGDCECTVCNGGYTLIDGTCVTSCTSNNCGTGKYCKYVGNCSSKGTGGCVDLPNASTVSATAGGVTQVYTKAASGMNWWSAQSYCEAKGLVMVSLSNIGCSSVADGKYCTTSAGSTTSGNAYSGSLLRAIQNAGWNTDTLWLSDKSSCKGKYAITLNSFIDSTNVYYEFANGSNPGHSSTAFCKCAPSSDSTTLAQCITYNSSCNCTACQSGYRVKNNLCVSCIAGQPCTQNSDCCNNTYCAFENPNSTSDKGNGVCREIATPSTSILRTNVSSTKTEWLKVTNYGMTWWSAQNWCLAKGYTAATRSSLGCSSFSEDSYCTDNGSAGWGKNNTALYALEAGGWNSNSYDLWRLESKSASLHYLLRGYNSYMETSTNDGDTPGYALCYKTYTGTLNKANCITYNTSGTCLACARGYKLQNGACSTACTTDPYCQTNNYDSSCNCIGCLNDTDYTLVDGKCYKRCSINSDCASLGNYFCSFQGATTCSGGNMPNIQGSCRPVSDWTASTPVTAGNGTVWVRSTTDKINWWSAKNWCEKKGLVMGSLTTLGCSNTTNSCSGGAVFESLRSKGWTTNYGWVSDNGYCTAYNVHFDSKTVSGSDGKHYSNAGYIALCTCPNIPNCTEYNTDCTCKTCASGYSGATCGACSPITDCGTYNGSCKCTDCNGTKVPSVPGNVCCNPNDTGKVGIAGCNGFSDSCYCNACKTGYTAVTSGSNKLCCPTEVSGQCKTYNTSTCECSSCNSGYTKISGANKCCQTVTNCATYDPDTCKCTACYSGWIVNSAGNACTACASIDGCDSYDGTCKCTHCTFVSTDPTHRYVNESGTACCDGVTNCLAYDDNCQCKSCPAGQTIGAVQNSDGYPLVDPYTGNPVVECRLRTEACSATANNCTHCSSGYTSAGDGYAECCCSVIDHCATYETYECDCACHECLPGYYLVNGKCISHCPAGYTASNSSSIASCYPYHCDETQYNCTDCESGYTSTSNGLCMPNTQQTCDVKYPGTGPSTEAYYSGGTAGTAGTNNSITCKCPYGWTWSGSQCTRCASGATSSAGACCNKVNSCTNYDSNCLCTECVNGYRPWNDGVNDQGCTSCMGSGNGYNCQTFDANCSCELCNDGYNLDSSTPRGCGSVCSSTQTYIDGVCCPNVNHCASYTFTTSDGSACGCQTCEDGYKKTTESSTTYNTRCCEKKPHCTSSSSCTQTYCSTYNLNCTCNTCASNYTLVDGDKCCSTKSNCTAYNASSCACTACANKYYVSSGSCVYCSNKVTMDSNCKTYDGDCVCTACNSGYTLVDGACVTSCTSNNCGSGKICEYPNTTCSSNGTTGGCVTTPGSSTINVTFGDVTQPFTKATSGMDWWNANNFCAYKGMVMVSVSDIGCGSVANGKYCTTAAGSTTSGNAYSGSLLRAIQNAGWNTDTLWLSDKSSCNGKYVITSNSLIQSTNVDRAFVNGSNTGHSSTALCKCAPITGCGVYSTSCTCTTCKNGYKKVGSSCSACSEVTGCKTYSQTDCSCTECKDNYRFINGACLPCVATGGNCSENNGCCSTSDYCSVNNSGQGTCAALSGTISATLRTNVNSTKTEWLRSSSEQMTWQTAQNWCAVQGYTAATLSSVGCSSVGSGSYCTDDGSTGLWGKNNTALYALEAAGWRNSTGISFAWLESASSSDAKAVRFTLASNNAGSISNLVSSNELKTSAVGVALCYKSYTGTLNKTNCITYNTSGTCVACARGYKLVSGACTTACPTVTNCATNGYGPDCGCILCNSGYIAVDGVCYKTCSYNAGCSGSEFCAFERPLSATDKGTGACMPLTDFGPRTGDDTKSTLVSNVAKSWIKGTKEMTSWSASNWCSWSSTYSRATRSSLGCGSVAAGKTCVTSSGSTSSGTAYNGSALRLLQTTSPTWTDAQKYWLETNGTSASYTVTMFGSGIYSNDNFSAKAYPLCVKTCDAVSNCSTYGALCGCEGCASGYTKISSACYKACSTNADCSSLGNYFCAFENPTGTCDSQKGDGGCLPVFGEPQEKTVTVNNKSTTWTRQTTGWALTRWSVENMASAMGPRYGVATREGLGCGNIPSGSTCNTTGTVLNALRNDGWSSASFDYWLESSGDCNAYSLDINTKNIQTKGKSSEIFYLFKKCNEIAGCSTYDTATCGCTACSSIANCKTYNSSTCACSSCNTNYDLSNGHCCPKKANCKEYSNDCNSCTKCNGGYTLADGACVACASSVEGCENRSECSCTNCTSPSMQSYMYYTNENGTACCQEIGKCKSYDDNCSCIECQSGYVIGYAKGVDGYGVSTGDILINIYTGQPYTQCYPQSVSPVGYYNDSCPGEYVMKDGVCCRVIKNCYKYDRDYGGDDCKCATCEDGYHEYKGKCYATCPTGFTPDGNYCRPVYCESLGDTMYDCEECETGYTPVNGVCVADSTAVCQALYSNTGPSTDVRYTGGVVATVAGVQCRCPTGWESIGSVCSQCESLHTDSSGECCELVVGCASYDSSCHCTACNEGYSYASNYGGSCSRCSSGYNCATFDNNCYCLTCAFGYQKSGNYCSKISGAFSYEGDPCTSSDQCYGDNFCSFENATSGAEPGLGTCTAQGSYSTVTVSGTTYYISAEKMNWYSAKAWCEKKGKQLVSSSNIGCGTPSQYCGSSTCAGSLPSGSAGASIKSSIGSDSMWVSDTMNTSYACYLQSNSYLTGSNKGTAKGRVVCGGG